MGSTNVGIQNDVIKLRQFSYWSIQNELIKLLHVSFTGRFLVGSGRFLHGSGRFLLGSDRFWSLHSSLHTNSKDYLVSAGKCE